MKEKELHNIDTRAMMPGKQTFPYYFCTGQDPTTLGQLKPKLSGHLEVISMIGTLCAQIRIYYYKKKTALGTIFTTLHFFRGQTKKLFMSVIYKFSVFVISRSVCTWHTFPA
jgi:hypothetical protein